MTDSDRVSERAQELAEILKDSLGSYLKPAASKEPGDVLFEAFKDLLEDLSLDYGVIGMTPKFSVRHIKDDVWEFDLDHDSYVSWVKKIVQLERRH